MNPAAERVYVRARQAGFPLVALGGLVRAGAGQWWNWAGSAPPAELEQANQQLDDVEAKLRQDAARVVEASRDAAFRLATFEDEFAVAASKSLADLCKPPASPETAERTETMTKPAGRVVTVEDPPLVGGAPAPPREASAPQRSKNVAADYAGSPEEQRDLEAEQALLEDQGSHA
ncbi:MAG: hypothetical protein ACRDLL_17495 [Solirubrobacterales bacterium]